jgi:type IV pilus assembly protein PilM
MAQAFSRSLSTAFAPPRYLSIPTLGVDLSTSGVKGVLLHKRSHGLELASFADVRFPEPAFADGDITDKQAIIKALRELRTTLGVSVANVALPESKSYLFETRAPGTKKEELFVSAEQHIDEYVPLPPQETVFDIVPLSHDAKGTLVAGVGYARRIVSGITEVCTEAGIALRALESETFAASRALLPFGDRSTVLIVDIGKTTTKLIISVCGIPRFATTIGIGGHSLTLSVQKHFGVDETEARRVKLAHGLVPGEGNDDYLGAMLSTASAIRDEIVRRLEYWQAHAVLSGGHDPVSRAIIVGGNASVRGLAEYLEGSLKIPVATGNVFTNFAPTDTWLPPIDYTQSLVYSTAIGLALREYVP